MSGFEDWTKPPENARDAFVRACAEERRLADLRDKLINRMFIIYAVWVIALGGLVLAKVSDGWIYLSVGVLLGAVWQGVISPWRKGRRLPPVWFGKTHIVEVLPGHTYKPGDRVTLGGVRYLVTEVNASSITVVEPE